MAKKQKTRHIGVFFYESKTRRCEGRPDQCFYIRYKVDGNSREEKVGWKSDGYTPQHAAELRSKRIRDARHGGDVKTQTEIRAEKRLCDRTLQEIKEHYFSTEKGKALKSKAVDLNRWKNHLVDIETKRISELSQLDIERIKQSMKDKSPATIANALELLRRVINHGANIGFCSALPFSIKKPLVNNELTEFLTDEEYNRLLKVLEEWINQDVARMVKLAIFTGMRRGEIFKLQWKHVDFDNKLIFLAEPKSGKDTCIPMNTMAFQILKEQQAANSKRLTANGEGEPANGSYVFAGKDGKQRVECTAITRIKKKAQLPAGFRPFHGLRHHYAIVLANSGEYTLDMIGELLTHANSHTTRRYAKFLPDTKRTYADRAAELLLKKGGGEHEKKEKAFTEAERILPDRRSSERLGV